jgi:hypothetical protein
MTTRRRPDQAALIITLLFLIPIGLATKFYHGPGHLWVMMYAGDIFYPMFWFFLGMLILPRVHPMKMSLAVFLFCTAVEFTQLLNGPLLLWLRQSFIGRTLVGVSFVWMDIVYYAAGCVVAVVVYYGLVRMKST